MSRSARSARRALALNVCWGVVVTVESHSVSDEGVLLQVRRIGLEFNWLARAWSLHLSTALWPDLVREAWGGETLLLVPYMAGDVSLAQDGALPLVGVRPPRRPVIWRCGHGPDADARDQDEARAYDEEVS